MIHTRFHEATIDMCISHAPRLSTLSIQKLVCLSQRDPKSTSGYQIDPAGIVQLNVAILDAVVGSDLVCLCHEQICNVPPNAILIAYCVAAENLLETFIGLAGTPQTTYRTPTFER